VGQWVYNTVFLESRNIFKFIRSRGRFGPAELGGDFPGSRMEHVDGGQDHPIDMYSFRTAEIAAPEDLRVVSERWPGIRFTLIFECLSSARVVAVGYVVATDGVCQQHWSSSIRADGAPLKPPENHPFDGLGRHSLTLDGYVRWLRQEGIAPSDHTRDSDACDTDDDW
jgi:hypothetical protein